MIAEDHALNQDFIKKLLGRMGFEHYDLVDDGVKALKAYNTADYDLIFMDCHMPEMSGYEVTREIREIEKRKGAGTAMPIVALTADAMPGTREKCLEAGMDEYISKPIDADKIAVILKRWFVLSSDSEEIGAAMDHDDKDIIDLSVIEDYADTKEEMQRFYDLFVTHTEDGLEVLDEHCVDGESVDWVEMSHRIKGSAGMLGAVRLQSICSQAQKMSDVDAGLRREKLVEIKDAYEQAKAMLASRLASLSD